MNGRWAAIASYLPQRTDNDIKNHWNTHLKKKLNSSLHRSPAAALSAAAAAAAADGGLFTSRGQWERRLQTDIHMAKQALSDALSPESSKPPPQPLPPAEPKSPHEAPAYASSADNIARWLKEWNKTTPPNSGRASSPANTNSGNCGGGRANEVDLSESFLGFDSFESSNSDQSPATSVFQGESEMMDESSVELLPMEVLEKWLNEDGKDYCFSEIYVDEKLKYDLL